VMTPPLLKALQPQENGLRRAQRQQQDGPRLHILTIVCNSSGYRLIRSIINTLDDTRIEEHISDYRYLTKLFADARREGFFEEVTPFAPDWKGYTDPKPDNEYTSSSDEEDYDEYENEQAREDAYLGMLWNSLGKDEVIVYEDERFDDGGYEFSWDEPNDDDYDNDY